MSMEPLDQENPYPAVKHLLDPILHDEYIKMFVFPNLTAAHSLTQQFKAHRETS